MSNITEQLFTTLVPKAAIIAYESVLELPDDSPQSTGDYLLECRPILEDGTMGAGKPVSEDFLAALAKLSGEEDGKEDHPHGMIPDNLLLADTGSRTRLVWYNPPCVRHRYFAKSLHIKDGDYHVPGCLYVVSGDSLQVYAFKGKKPHPQTRLLWGPFFNLYSSHVCLGNAKAKMRDGTWADIIRYWESLFWDSMDAHMGEFCPTKGNLVVTIRKYKDIPFDCSCLKETGKKLKDITDA